MSEKIEIYGIKYQLPKRPPLNEIANYKLPRALQKFERVSIPDSFYDIEFDDDGNPLYTEKQRDFIFTELQRVRDGYWFSNNGDITYITGLHYFYLNYWTLEDGNKPDYRDVDRRYFCFQDYCEKQNTCDGIIRIKKRREGATSQAACYLLYKAITQPKSNCGIVSKTGNPDAKDVFQKMIMTGYRNLPIFMKPRTADGDSETRLHFRAVKSKSKKPNTKRGQIFSEDIGLDSIIDYRNTKLNSYDSGRVTAILIDEGGKFPADVAINQYWPIVRKTLKKGAIRVGFALIPSTVNDSENGGKEFKEIWDESDHTTGSTGSGLFRYFTPAYDGYEGFIDEYGMSIIDKPTERQRKFIKEKFGMDIDCGAMEYLQRQRSIIKDQTALSEEIRMNPFTESEAFMIDAKKCYFNQTKLYDQLEFLAENRVALRKGNFIWKSSTTVDFEDDKNGLWQIYAFPSPELRNRVMNVSGNRQPGNTDIYCSGIDPFRSSVISGKGSNGAIFITQRLNAKDPNNTGLPVAFYLGRPKLKSLFHDEVLKACVFYGCKATYENDVGDDFYDYFVNKGFKGWLSKTPEAAISKNKKRSGNILYGVASRDPFALEQQLQVAINYVEMHSHKIYYPELIEDMLAYDHLERTKSDITVAFMISLLSLMSHDKSDTREARTIQFVQTYRLNV